jgi:Kef-type K+ transport system membrane component KefB
MSSKSEDDDDDAVMRSSIERYERVGANLDWFIILASASSIFFGFLLNIAVDPPSYFTFFYNVILLAALYAVTVATAMFILPVIFHATHYRKLDVERFLLRNKQYVLIGIFCVMLAMYLDLGLLLTSKLPGEIAYGLASLPFIFICFEFFRHMHK